MKKVVYLLVLKGYILSAQHKLRILRSDTKTLSVRQGSVLCKNDREVELGSNTFLNTPIVLENDRIHTKIKNSSYGQLTSLMGMYLLKRLNMILDFQSNEINLKANSLLRAPFKNQKAPRYIKIDVPAFLMSIVDFSLH